MKIPSFFIRRKIQVHLLTVFLFLLALSIAIITRYTYTKYYHNISELSLKMIDQVSNLLFQEIKDVKGRVELTSEIIKDSIEKRTQVSLNDPDYLYFLVNILKSIPFLTEIVMADPSGDFIVIMDAQLQDAQEEIPKGCKYIICSASKKNGVFEQVWQYLNEKGEVLLSQRATSDKHPFFQESWVLQILEEPKAKWASDSLEKEDSYFSNKSRSIIFSDVVHDVDGNVSVLLSIGVTLQNLSDLILSQKIGGNGSIFIVDEQGRVRAPISNENNLEKTVLEKACEEFKEQGKSDFLIKEGEGKYLVAIRDLPFVENEKWKVITLASFDQFFGQVVKTENRTRLMSLFVFLVCGLITYFGARHISKPIVKMAKNVDRIRDFDFTPVYYEPSQIIEISDLEASIEAMRAALFSFGHYVPKEIVKRLVKYGKDVTIGGEKLELTIMFSDIEHFTTFSETLPIEKLMAVLSDYFDVVSKIILEADGTIDKYIGDSVMSFWGAPLPIKDHAEKACFACLQCLLTIQRLGKWKTRFGIHTGDVIVGNIGTFERMNYTVIGDAVNVASRLQSLNKEYNTYVLISQEVKQRLNESFVTRPIDFVAVRGKQAKMRVFELIGMKNGALSAKSELIELAKLFTEAYFFWEEGKKEIAKEHFLKIQEKFPLDLPTKIYLERLSLTTN